MIESTSKQPLLLQLLQERRKFAELVCQMYSGKGITEDVLRNVQAEENRRRYYGSRALPLHKVLVKKELLTDKEVAEALRAARQSNDSFIKPPDMEGFRRALGEGGATIEKVLVKLDLASELDIAGAYAEYLHLPIARQISSNFGDVAIGKYKERGVTDTAISELNAEQEKTRLSGKQPRMLGEMLIERGLLNEEELKDLLEEQTNLGKREGEVMTDP